LDLGKKRVRLQGDFIFYASADLRADKEIAMAAVRADGAALQYLDNLLQDDPEVVLTAVASRQTALTWPPPLQWASPRLRDDEAFMARALEIQDR